MTYADDVMSPQYFGSSLAHIRIQIQINLDLD